MYQAFYGLKGKPFRMGPDPKYFHDSSVHARAMAQLSHGLAEGEGFIVVTGEAGTGKTTLVGHALGAINPSKRIQARLDGSGANAEDLLRLAASAFRLPFEGRDRASLINAIRILLVECARRGNRPVLVVDEADKLRPDALEELRLMTDLQAGDAPLLQCILIGQPRLRDILADAPMEQIRQRVVAACHLSPMTPDDTRAYIKHRLARAGWVGDPRFSPDGFASAHRHTAGVPRQINLLCGRLLVYAALERLHRIDANTVDDIARKLDTEIGPVDCGIPPATVGPRQPAPVLEDHHHGPSPAVGNIPWDSDIGALRELARQVESLS